MRGVPWWAAAVVAVAGAGVGIWVGGVWFSWGAAVGCVLAAVLVRREGYFTVLAQPPLVVGGVMGGALALGKPVLSAVAEVSATFPHLIATMVVVGLVVSGRVLGARVRRGRVA